MHYPKRTIPTEPNRIYCEDSRNECLVATLALLLNNGPWGCKHVSLDRHMSKISSFPHTCPQILDARSGRRRSSEQRPTSPPSWSDSCSFLQYNGCVTVDFSRPSIAAVPSGVTITCFDLASAVTACAPNGCLESLSPRDAARHCFPAYMLFIYGYERLDRFLGRNIQGTSCCSSCTSSHFLVSISSLYFLGYSLRNQLTTGICFRVALTISDLQPTLRYRGGT